MQFLQISIPSWIIVIDPSSPNLLQWCLLSWMRSWNNFPKEKQKGKRSAASCPPAIVCLWTFSCRWTRSCRDNISFRWPCRGTLKASQHRWSRRGNCEDSRSWGRFPPLRFPSQIAADFCCSSCASRPANRFSYRRPALESANCETKFISLESGRSWRKQSKDSLDTTLGTAPSPNPGLQTILSACPCHLPCLESQIANF